jgi:Holliday junction resolvasome RuvABC endonuclease subunit
MYLGVDPSLTGFAAFSLNHKLELAFETFAIRTTHKNFSCFSERLDHIAKAWQAFLERVIDERGPIELAAIEGPSYGPRRSSMADEMATVHQIARLELWRAGVPYVEAPPKTLKRWISGTGTAEKNLMLREVFKRWGYNAQDDNDADAYALARLAQQWHRGVLDAGDQGAGAVARKEWQTVVKACKYVEARG